MLFLVLKNITPDLLLEGPHQDSFLCVNRALCQAGSQGGSGNAQTLVEAPLDTEQSLAGEFRKLPMMLMLVLIKRDVFKKLYSTLIHGGVKN